jgi:hypothetical protein
MYIQTVLVLGRVDDFGSHAVNAGPEMFVTADDLVTDG